MWDKIYNYVMHRLKNYHIPNILGENEAKAH